MTLREMQSLHVRLTGRLINYAYAQGYDLTWGETLRSRDEAVANVQAGLGIAESLHILGLAVDLHLFKNAVYLTDSNDYLVLGVYWKSLHTLARWGGDFKPKADGNHFSVEWQGRK